MIDLAGMLIQYLVRRSRSLWGHGDRPMSTMEVRPTAYGSPRAIASAGARDARMKRSAVERWENEGGSSGPQSVAAWGESVIPARKAADPNPLAALRHE